MLRYKNISHPFEAKIFVIFADSKHRAAISSLLQNFLGIKNATIRSKLMRGDSRFYHSVVPRLNEEFVMKKFLFLSVIALLFAGCKPSVQEEQKDVREAQDEAAENVAEEQQDVNEAMKEGEEAVEEEKQDVNEAVKEGEEAVDEEKKDVNEAVRDGAAAVEEEKKDVQDAIEENKEDAAPAE
jgi:hypothetical protein